MYFSPRVTVFKIKWSVKALFVGFGFAYNIAGLYLQFCQPCLCFVFFVFLLQQHYLCFVFFVFFPNNSVCVFAPTTVFGFVPQQQGHSPYPTVHTELFIHSLGDRWPVAIHNIIVMINIVIVVKDIIIILMFKLSWGPLAGGHTQHYLSRRYPHHHLHTSHMAGVNIVQSAFSNVSQ